MINSDGTKIYSFFTFGGNSKYIHLAVFNEADGSIIGSRYKSSIGCSGVYGSDQNGDIIVLTAPCSSDYYLVMMNTITNIFTIKQFPGYLAGVAVLPGGTG